MEKSEEKINQSISRNGFIGFVVSVIISFIMEFVLGNEEAKIQIPNWVKFIIYMIMISLVLIFGVEKPNMMAFLKTVRDALADGKLTAEEAMAIIRQGWFLLLGFWADVSQVAQKEEEKKDDPIELL